MTDLVKFLKARLDEDEERLDAIDHVQAPAGHMARERREVEAKRQLIAEVWDSAEGFPTEHTPGNTADAVLKALALPYADHPDYRGEWRPD